MGFNNRTAETIETAMAKLAMRPDWKYCQSGMTIYLAMFNAAGCRMMNGADWHGESQSYVDPKQHYIHAFIAGIFVDKHPEMYSITWPSFEYAYFRGKNPVSK